MARWHRCRGPRTYGGCWQRLAPRARGDDRGGCHVRPAPSEVIIVTGEAVLKALLDDRITVRQAMAANLLLVSSTDAQAASVEQWLTAAFARDPADGPPGL